MGFNKLKIKNKFIILSAISMFLCSSTFAADFNVLDKLKEPSAYFNDEAVKLYQAVSTGDMKKARDVMVQGTRANSKGPETLNQNIQQISLLSYSLGVNDTKTAQRLISLGANPLYRPSIRNGDSFLFLISRKNVKMLNFLYDEWPVTKIPQVDQKNQVFLATFNSCQECLEVMFEKGINPNVKDENGYNIFMQALDNEDWQLAWWLLSKAKVSIDAESSNGITPANSIQFNMYKFSKSAIVYEKLMDMKKFVENNYSVKFPVATRLQIMKRKNLNN